MTTIYCTKKLAGFLKLPKDSPAEESAGRFGNWNAHLFFIQRQKHLIFVNNKSYYVLLFENFAAVERKNFQKIFSDRLIEQLLFDHIIETDEALVILNSLLPIRLSHPNNDKRAIAVLNNYIRDFKIYKIIPDWMYRSLQEINSTMNEGIVGGGRTGYVAPADEMKKLIKKK